LHLHNALAAAVDRAANALRPHTREGSRTRQALGLLRTKLPRPSPNPSPHAQVMSEFARAYPKAFFVQVGSHDGTQLDPLREQILSKQWSGVMVEPVPFVFERLRENYGRNPRLILENVAIADRDGTRQLTYLPQTSDEGLPAWYDALASFRRDVILSTRHKAIIPDIEQRVAVPCLTFDSLCRKHGITQLDVVQIDTEGYDFEVIKLIDLPKLRPKLVMFERLHFDTTTHEACLAHLRDHGYESHSNPMDTLCLHGEVLARNPRLHQLWRRLQDAADGELA
jgi:FkbM family methyltransferase